MKYIVILHPVSKLEIPIVFPDEIGHYQMVPKSHRSSRSDRLGYKMFKYKVLSGGFCSLSPEVTVHGHSESLKIGNRGDTDVFLLTAFVVLGMPISLQAFPICDQKDLVKLALGRQ